MLRLISKVLRIVTDKQWCILPLSHCPLFRLGVLEALRGRGCSSDWLFLRKQLFREQHKFGVTFAENGGAALKCWDLFLFALQNSSGPSFKALNLTVSWIAEKN